MPSPFPGMDPYLEGPLWMGIHTQLSTEIARQLAPRLRPKYVAHTAERVIVAVPEGTEYTERSVYPDVGVVHAGAESEAGKGTAIAEAPLRLQTVLPDKIPHVSVEIRDALDLQLVTAIEVLSPFNKRGDGREEYLRKRAQVLRSTAHLLEIDLLREGLRVPMLKPLPPAPYFVLLSRVESRPVSEVWPITLREPLPTVPVPLLAPDPDVPLNLQRALGNVYDLLSYDLVVQYSRPPGGPLSPQDAAWVEERARAAAERSE